MNLYNVLSINGIDIDKYLEGGSSEEINNLHNSITYLNNNQLNSNIRLFNYEKYNNYMINNYSSILPYAFNCDNIIPINYNEATNESYIFNYINSFVSIMYDVFSLNSNVNIACFENVYLEPRNMLLPETNTNHIWIPKTLLIHFNNTYDINEMYFCYHSIYENITISSVNIILENHTMYSNYSPNIYNFTALTMNIMEQYLDDDKVHHFCSNVITNCNYRLNEIINNTVILYKNTITNLDIKLAGDEINIMFSECVIQNLTINYDDLATLLAHNNIKTLFKNCTITNLYVYYYKSFSIINSFCDGLTINDIYLNNTNTSDFVSKFKIPNNYTDKIHTFS